MSFLAAESLLSTPLVEVVTVFCSSPRAPGGTGEWNRAPQVVVPRRGVFAVHRQRRSAVADPTTVVVFGADEEFRVSHPIGGGDECIALTLRQDVHEDAFGRSDGQVGGLSATTQLRVAVLVGALGGVREDVFALEEAAVRLAEELALGVRGEELDRRLSPRQRRRSDEVRAVLAEDPSRRWRLADVGQAVQCSPFHLARQFRLATGETLSRHLLRLRLSAALHQMAEGEGDLGRIATDVGFTHHSHFSARFREVFGCTPSRARSLLTAKAYLRTEHDRDSASRRRAVASHHARQR